MSGATDLISRVDVLAVLLISALGAGTDFARGRIFNWLTVPAAACGLAVSAWSGGWAGLGGALIAMLAGLALYGWLFALGAMGGGDVKFLMALGAWGGLRFVFETAVLGIGVGGVLALGMLVAKGRLRDFAGRLRHFLLTVFLKELRIEAPKIDHSGQMPFGIPIAIAASWVVLGHPLEWLGMGL